MKSWRSSNASRAERDGASAAGYRRRDDRRARRDCLCTGRWWKESLSASGPVSPWRRSVARDSARSSPSMEQEGALSRGKPSRTRSDFRSPGFRMRAAPLSAPRRSPPSEQESWPTRVRPVNGDCMRRRLRATGGRYDTCQEIASTPCSRGSSSSGARSTRRSSRPFVRLFLPRTRDRARDRVK